MPGITGIISKKPAPINEADLTRMLASVISDSLYSKGKYVNSELGLYIGWHCHRNSFSDCMPIFNETKDRVLFFTGEEFSDEQTVISLKERGHQFELPLDARYLIHLHEEMDDSFFPRLNGSFHGLIADIQKRQVTLFNDRFGMNRLYVYAAEDEFLFSSEAKAILSIRPELRKIDPYSLGEYFSYGCVLGGKTVFKDIFLLPGGSIWSFDFAGRLCKRRYFTPGEWESQPVLKEYDFYEAVLKVLGQVIPRYLRSKGRLGLSLTGGLDTRMILALSKIEPGTLPCFTFGGIYRDSYDVKVSKEIASACSQPHKVLRLDRRFIDEFPQYAEKTIYISDGTMDVTGAPNLYANELARQIADIRLTGNYGQELLRRYVAFRPGHPSEKLFDPGFVPYLIDAKKTYLANLEGNRLTFAMFKQAPWYQYGRLSVESSQLVQRSPYMDNDLVKLVYRAPDVSLKGEQLSRRIILEGHSALSRIMTDRGLLGNHSAPVSALLRCWREISFKLEWYHNNRFPRWAVDLEPFSKRAGVERLFLGMHKYYHMRVWLRDEWSEFTRAVLLDPRCLNRGFLNGAFVSEMVISHINGTQSFTDLLITALSVELLHRLFIDVTH